MKKKPEANYVTVMVLIVVGIIIIDISRKIKYTSKTLKAKELSVNDLYFR